MKKNVLFFALIALIAVFSSNSLNAQVSVTCYEAPESEAPDFWLDHFYYGMCTDWEANNMKLVGEGPYMDFNGGASLVFNNVFVSETDTYTFFLTYGVGWADEIEGATMKLYVNDEFVQDVTVYRPGEGEENQGRILPLTIELYGDEWANEIKFTQSVHWPTILGGQLSKDPSGIKNNNKVSYSIATGDSSISISNLSGTNSVQVYDLAGRLIDSKTVSGSYSASLQKGIYVVKVNNQATKVLVK